VGIKLRAETPADYAKISSVIENAFGQKAEVFLVDRLRKAPEFVKELSIVAETNGVILGHVLLYPVPVISPNIDPDTNSDDRAIVLALAPISVDGAHQNRGIGEKIIHHAIAQAKALGYGTVIVLGDSLYYSRFGFLPASRWGIRPPFDAPDDAFMALELKDGCLDSISGTVVYPAPFLDV
jgi:putative acetyltransferase